MKLRAWRVDTQPGTPTSVTSKVVVMRPALRATATWHQRIVTSPKRSTKARSLSPAWLLLSGCGSAATLASAYARGVSASTDSAVSGDHLRHTEYGGITRRSWHGKLGDDMGRATVDVERVNWQKETIISTTSVRYSSSGQRRFGAAGPVTARVFTPTPHQSKRWSPLNEIHAAVAERSGAWSWSAPQDYSLLGAHRSLQVAARLHGRCGWNSDIERAITSSSSVVHDVAISMMWGPDGE